MFRERYYLSEIWTVREDSEATFKITLLAE